jgi:hypothetical protein
VSPLAAALVLTIAQASSAAAPPPPACTGEAYAAFDFWVGEWDVYPNGKDKLVAHSRIEKLYGGCAIRENWMPLSGTGGGSLSDYEPATGRWHQTWIGSAPGRVEFDGGPANGGMVLTGWWPGVGGPGKDGLVRMSYTRTADGSVRQFGEVSYDQGVSWETSFDFIYRRRAKA